MAPTASRSPLRASATRSTSENASVRVTIFNIRKWSGRNRRKGDRLTAERFLLTMTLRRTAASGCSADHGGLARENDGGLMRYGVKELADLSGVTVRTLHFYDQVGLLKPAGFGANGYRFYEEKEVLHLQQILFFRELGFELKQIKRILARSDFDRRAALESQIGRASCRERV